MPPPILPSALSRTVNSCYALCWLNCLGRGVELAVHDLAAFGKTVLQSLQHQAWMHHE